MTASLVAVATPRPLRPRTLADHHRRMLEVESGIAPELIEARGYWTATTKAELKELGFGDAQCLAPALVLPIRSPADGDITLYQARPDRPRVKGAKIVKYETVAGARMALDVPPVSRPHIGNPKVPLFLTEGIRKADALASIGCCAVGLIGVWNFVGRNPDGGKTLLPEWRYVALNERETYVLYDSDVTIKPAVQGALHALVDVLKHRGARVRVVYLPPLAGGAKCGADDFVVELRGRGITDHQLILKDILRHAEDDVRPLPKSERPERPVPYFADDHGLHWRKTKDGAEEVITLCNFSARIVREIVEDDGVEVRRLWEISATYRGRTVVFTVSAGRFASLDWVAEQLGAGAVVDPGQGRRGRVPAAIQLLSGDPPLERRVARTGWDKIDGQYYYLTSTGGIGADGLRPELAASLTGALQRYALPAPPEGEARRAALRSTFQLLAGFVPDRVMVVLLAAVFRAPVGRPIDLTPFLYGPTQSGKSELAALMQQFFGPTMDRNNLPANWASTEAALEGLLFGAADALLVIDDFLTKGDQVTVQRMHAKADRVLRAQGNSASRQRANVDGTVRPDRPPRGIALSTGEELPLGESLQARCPAVEVERGDIDPVRLAEAAAAGARGDYAAAFAAYVRWLAPRLPEVQAEVAASVVRLRAEFAGNSVELSRTPTNLAQLAAGWEQWLRFAVNVEALTDTEAADLWQRVLAALQELGRRQRIGARESDPARQFVALLSSCFASGRAYLTDTAGETPPADVAMRWGWHLETVGAADVTQHWRARGEHIGWLGDDETVYLDPALAFAAVARLARDNHDPIAITRNTLSRRLRQANLLVLPPASHEGVTVRRTLQGRQRDVWQFHRMPVEPEQPAEAADPIVTLPLPLPEPVLPASTESTQRPRCRWCELEGRVTELDDTARSIQPAGQPAYLICAACFDRPNPIGWEELGEPRSAAGAVSVGEAAS